ncbi:hypothetical protein EOA13_08770 [Mesorhizobium sp. M7A.F.Ca.US.011.01.1.1]|nr:hypothetical protein EOA13_08770 [Mesorhizobium sp. M7A.F.Ca.US.011.01.1.1]
MTTFPISRQCWRSLATIEGCSATPRRSKRRSGSTMPSTTARPRTMRRKVRPLPRKSWRAARILHVSTASRQ